MHETDSGRGWGLSLLLVVVALTLVSSCSGNLEVDRHQGTSTDGRAAPPAKRSITGQLLAHVDVTPTHSVEFWEIKPGSVAMVQLIKPGASDKSLDLGPMLLQAGGTYRGLYRKLLSDPNAALSPELVAADERRSHLPIRDASLPRPKRAEPPHSPRTHGTPATMPSQASVQPGTVRTQTLVGWNDVYDNSGITNFDCNGPEVDGGWCPGGAYDGFAYGEADEVIYYDVAGYNPQGYPSDNGYENDDTFYVYEYDPANPAAGWATEINWDLWPGETLRVTFVGSPAQYYGEVDGNLVAFADRYRLSFPALSLQYNDPDWSNKGTFGNDIEGIAHAHCPGPVGCNAALWFFSRTEFKSGNSNHGQIGISGDLGQVAYGCTYEEPASWSGSNVGGPTTFITASGYRHYGDIAYEPATYRSNDGYLLVSLNDAQNHSAAVGFLGLAANPSAQCKYTLLDWGAVELSPSEQAPCVAKTNKYRTHYVADTYEDINYAHIYVPASLSWNALHEYLINISSTPTVVWSQDITIVNSNWQTSTEIVNSPNGLKASSHGKLYMWGVATKYETGRLYGIDPFSGMIQTEYDVNYGGAGSSWGYIESEGLDIIDPTDVGLVRSPSGVPFQGAGILVQMLANSPDEDAYNSRWSGVVISVDDPNRL